MASHEMLLCPLFCVHLILGISFQKHIKLMYLTVADEFVRFSF